MTLHNFSAREDALGTKKAFRSRKASKYLVRKERLELSRLTALEPKSSASTNSATLAFK